MLGVLAPFSSVFFAFFVMGGFLALWEDVFLAALHGFLASGVGFAFLCVVIGILKKYDTL